MKFHLVARPVSNLLLTKDMYCRGLGLPVLGHFEDHEGFDGVMLGSPEMHYHFEFTSCKHHRVQPTPIEEDLIVFYVSDETEWVELCEKMVSAGFTFVKSFNPYWDNNGRTFVDPDGYRIVIQNDTWVNRSSPDA